MRNESVKDLETGVLEYTTVGEFLADLKKEFDGENNKIIKVAELKRIEQESKTTEEFVQEFKMAAKKSRYDERPLVEEFKREINKTIRRKLIETERSLRSIKQ